MDNKIDTMPFQDSGLSEKERIDDLLGRLSLEEKISILSETAVEIERLGVEAFYHGNEALHGVVRPGKFTVFPQAIAMAATWNQGLIREMATAISDEARARHNELGGEFNDSPWGGGRYCGVLTFWSPTVNMTRDPRWGRSPETYGEDPFLTGQIGVEFVKGLQGDDPKYTKVISTPKHFTANNEEHNRFECNAKMSEQVFRDYYLPAFKACIVEGKAEGIMAAYNAINGVPCHASEKLLTEILRDEWGFDGYVVTDCGAIAHIVETHNYANTPEAAAAAAINAGVDLECGPNGPIADVFLNHLQKAHEQGLVTQETIDRATGNVIKARMRLGTFDPQEMVPWSKLPPETVGCEKHKKLALEVARQSITLLKNESVDGKKILPLPKTGSIAVMGYNAAECQFGDYSGEPLNTPVSPIDGIMTEIEKSECKITHVPWTWRGSQSDYAPIPKDCFSTAAENGERGLSGEYYANSTFEGTPRERVDQSIDFDWENLPPDEFTADGAFSIKWQGFLVAPVTGQYKFRVTSRGTGSCYPAKTVINNHKISGETGLPLVAGEAYPILIEFAKIAERPLIQVEWIPPQIQEDTNPFAAEVAAAKANDKVIAVLGLGREFQHEDCDRLSMDLPDEQMAMLKAVAEVNKNIIVILITGSAMTIKWMDDNVPAILNAWYPGEQGGTAIAEILFGKCNPSGKLPVTFYQSVDQLPAFDDYEIVPDGFMNKGRTYQFFTEKPLYSFGFGLSYTEFSYSDLNIKSKELQRDDNIDLTFKLTNTGNRDGAEIVQIYAASMFGDISHPIKRLIGFAKVELSAGDSLKVEMEIPLSRLERYDCTDKCYSIEKGDYKIMLGGSSADIKLSETILIES